MIVGLALIGFGWIMPADGALLGAATLFLTWQPLLRARMQFWRYGLSAGVQALTLLILILCWLDARPQPDVALWAYAISYFAGFVVSWLASDAPLPRFPGRTEITSIFSVGGALTLSTVAENGVYLGFRYVIAVFGSPHLLGVFSFAVDLAQRSVGVVVNIASFALVPRAYKAEASGNPEQFRLVLLRGTALAASLSLVVLVGVYFLYSFNSINYFQSPLFSFTAVTAASLAIIMNRSKKLALDPMLVVAGASLKIGAAYLVVACIILPSVTVLLLLEFEKAAVWLYPIAYLMVTVLSLASWRSGSNAAVH